MFFFFVFIFLGHTPLLSFNLSYTELYFTMIHFLRSPIYKARFSKDINTTEISWSEEINSDEMTIDELSW